VLKNKWLASLVCESDAQDHKLKKPNKH